MSSIHPFVRDTKVELFYLQCFQILRVLRTLKYCHKLEFVLEYFKRQTSLDILFLHELFKYLLLCKVYYCQFYMQVPLMALVVDDTLLCC